MMALGLRRKHRPLSMHSTNVMFTRSINSMSTKPYFCTDWFIEQIIYSLSSTNFTGKCREHNVPINAGIMMIHVDISLFCPAGTYCVSFDYHMYARRTNERRMGTIELLAGETVLWSETGNHGRQWHSVTLNETMDLENERVWHIYLTLKTPNWIFFKSEAFHYRLHMLIGQVHGKQIIWKINKNFNNEKTYSNYGYCKRYIAHCNYNTALNQWRALDVTRDVTRGVPMICWCYVAP